MSYKDFKEMPVWQNAFKILLTVYELTKTYPKEEKYGLVSYMRRAANSVTNNISVPIIVFVGFVSQNLTKLISGWQI